MKDLPDSMLVFGLINVCEAVRNRMYFNAKRGVRTWLYVEEMGDVGFRDRFDTIDHNAVSK